jgi:hypothetical protein
MTTRKKIVIAAAMFSVFCLISLLAAGILALRSLTDTDSVKSLAAGFMTIGSPLPEGFHFLSGYTVVGVPVVQIKDDQAKMLYTFTASQSGLPPSKYSEAERMIENAAEGKPPSALGYGTSNKIAVRVHDRLTVAGESMHYVLGHTDNPLNTDKSSTNAFFGAVQSSSTGRLIILLIQRSTVLSKDHSPLTIERIKTLTDCIKSL